MSRRTVLTLAAIGLIPDGRLLAVPEPASAGLQLPGALLTLDLIGLTLDDAAERLTQVVGFPFRLDPDGERITEADDPDEPVRIPSANPAMKLDRTRTAGLRWNAAPLGRALREFCAAYDCDLAWNTESGGINIVPGPFPRGPVVTVAGCAVEVAEIRFDDRRLFHEPSGNPGPSIDRQLTIELKIRFTGDSANSAADAAAFAGLGYLRVADAAGRDALYAVDDPEPEGVAETTPFPDECRRRLSIDWPYPAPQRLPEIQGELVLFRNVKRQTVEFDLVEFDREKEPPAQLREDLGGLVRLQQGLKGEGETQCAIALGARGGTEIVFAGFPHAWVTRADGSRIPLLATPDGGETIQGIDTSTFMLTMPPDDVPLKGLTLNLARRSKPDRRVPFRFRNFPAQLAPAEPAPIVPAAKSTAPSRPSPARPPQKKAR